MCNMCFIFKSLCEAWLKHGNVRRIVLNKSRQAQVVNLHKKSSKYINKECIVLSVVMSDDPAELKIRAGNGKLFKLLLMEGVQPTKDIPDVIDVLPGDTCTPRQIAILCVWLLSEKTSINKIVL